ncbi:uncharacterized protein LOC111693923 [Trichogramma pretiosum]|uniref:uncharacterized protein LOC111693923 n=1 Tax=Trichogramma pretiosum TaxID=7493 RepID=UPI000C719892|nr:uncharacterized protein LOC111693923 [Trichogramma pretiosum]
MADNDQEWLRRVQTLRQNLMNRIVGSNIYQSQRNLLYRFYLLTNFQRVDQLPNLREFFRGEEIDWILAEFVKSATYDYSDNRETLINFVIRTGYKDEPEVDKDGRPLLHRTTALHHADKSCEYYRFAMVSDLFKIYDRFDANYTDEYGYTHFHVACEFECYEAIQQFLDLGQDPNCPVPKTGNSPLHLALIRRHTEVAELLLIYGADPNLANKSGSTPLHLICEISDLEFKRLRTIPKFVDTFFKICDEKRQTVQVDVRDKSGQTPLHLALERIKEKEAELLLRRGANPNLANEDGSTPLHLICTRYDENDFVETFFKIIDDKHQPLEVNARDKWGRTPLEYAVERLLPITVDFLLDHGADVSNFVFPNVSQSDDPPFHGGNRLMLACRVLLCAQHLEERGYELDRDDVLTMMKWYTMCDSMRVVGLSRLCEEDKNLLREEKIMKMNTGRGLTVYDLLYLEPEEAAKRVVYKDCYDLTRSQKYNRWFSSEFREACANNLCDVLPRRHFLRWTLDPFMELINYRLPHLPCEMILDNLNIVDLYSICLAVSGKNS